jgi:AraC family transcriptional regulator
MTLQQTMAVVARQICRTVCRGDLLAFEAIYAPHSQLLDHQHEWPFFTYVLRGDYVERVGQLRRECTRGSVIFHSPQECHANVVGSRGTASLNVEIPFDIWRELTDGVSPARDVVGRVLSGDVEWIALAVWREFRNDDAASPLGLDEAVTMLCAEVTGLNGREPLPNPALRRCVEYLRAYPTATPRLAEVARVGRVHPMHVAKLFRKQFGYSMGEFLRRQRIAWACERLSSEADTIGAIAARAGFADHAHFTRTFRRLTGCSPRWYRQQLGRTARRGF